MKRTRLSNKALKNKRESDKKYQKEKRARLIGYKAEEYRKWRKKHPEAYKAHQLLNAAVKKGKIKKSPCVDCGATHRIQAHHPNYSEPYKVI